MDALLEFFSVIAELAGFLEGLRELAVILWVLFYGWPFIIIAVLVVAAFGIFGNRDQRR